MVFEFEKDVDEIESAVFSRGGSHEVERVYQLKRELIEFKRCVMPLGAPLLRLATRELPVVPPEAKAYFRELADHHTEAREAVASFDEVLTSILQAGLARASVADNEDMRKISAWVAIVAVPTMVAGIYGMNFDNMPELHLALRLLRRARPDRRDHGRALHQLQTQPLAVVQRARSRAGRWCRSSTSLARDSAPRRSVAPHRSVAGRVSSAALVPERCRRAGCGLRARRERSSQRLLERGGAGAGHLREHSRAWAATLCSQSTSYFVATVWVTEVKSRWPRVMHTPAALNPTANVMPIASDTSSRAKSSSAW